MSKSSSAESAVGGAGSVAQLELEALQAQLSAALEANQTLQDELAQVKDDLANAELAKVAPARGEVKPPSAFVPVLRDEDGKEILRKTSIRILSAKYPQTTPDGVRISETKAVEVQGTDIREGDWFCISFAAGLIVVDKVKKL